MKFDIKNDGGWPHGAAPTYLDALPEDLKADEKTVRQRLAVCEKCDFLWDGICRKCGCYVQARAAKKDRRCAHESRFW